MEEPLINLPESGAPTLVWLVVAVVIVGLYFVIKRTRQRSLDHYWNQQRREQERRDNDPDMKRD